MRARRRAPGLILVLSVIFSSASPVVAEIRYVYDQLGRLTGVIDATGDTAVYSYDPVGNLLSISRYASSTVSVIDLTPSSGVVGATVTISGTGFGPTAGQNTVTFNGAAASVVSSTASQIVTSVPVGATTGPVVVTVAAGSAPSPGPFTVTAPSTPSITGFTPTLGMSGTTVRVTGTNFESVAQNNRLNFNIARAALNSASATALDTTVPNNATSGRLTVATPDGSAQSSDDFFVPPPGFTTGDVVATGRVIIDGGNLTSNITAANKIGLVVFDGTAGQRVSLGVVQVANRGSSITVFRPDGATLLSQGVSSTSCTSRVCPRRERIRSCSILLPQGVTASRSPSPRTFRPCRSASAEPTSP
jgi:YD repeat-containing protein